MFRGSLVARLSLCCAGFACGGQAAPAPVPIGVTATPSASAAAVASDATPKPCDDDYRLAEAPTGAKPDLPPVPLLPDTPRKTGDAFTVFGAVHALRSRFEEKQLPKDEIAIVGWIVDSNIPRAPKCAWHKTGVADPRGCVAEMPSFVIADAKDTKPDDPAAPHIKVLGWAHNFAAVFDATAQYKGLTAPPKKLLKDDIWSVDLPFPLPAIGTRVKVKGRYAFAFTKATSGVVADPRNGVLTYSSLEVVP